MRELFLTTPDGQIRRIPLEQESVSLGRSWENTLSFPEDSRLSRLHLVLEIEGAQWTVSDLGSKNGTFVNGKRISQRHYLRPGDRISAGHVLMIYKDPEGSRATVTFQTPAPAKAATTTESISLTEALLAAAAEGAGGARLGLGPSGNALRAFVRASRQLAVRRPLAELFDVILDISMEAVGAERGLVLTLDDQDRLVTRASSGDEFRISTTVADRVLRQRDSLLIQDVLSDELLKASQVIVGQGVRSLMAVPLQTDDRVLGLLYVDSLQAQRAFSADDLSLLTVLANVASIFIERERWEIRRRDMISENIATLERLAAALSHDLNSPLGALKSTVDTLARLWARQETAPPEERHRLTELQASLQATLAASLERMQRVIGRLQRFTDLDRAEVRTVDLNELLSDVLSLLDTRSKHGEIEVEFYFGELPAVTCRPQHLTAVFSNVLKNAFQACRGIGRTGRVRLSTRVCRGMVEVEIEDNGVGISAEDLDRIFDPAFQVAEGRVASGNWSLFSSRQMVLEQGGDIRISSEEGIGTSVVISLPAASRTAPR